MPTTTSLSPYIGLAPYTEADARFFFGRENDQQIITANLYASRLTILYGASGVGKSSVLQAGVTLHLHQRPGQAVVVFNDWQANPVIALKHVIADEIRRVMPGAEVLDYNLPLDKFLQQCTARMRLPLMVLLDQFEEYLLYHPTDESPVSFAAEFARAVNQEGLLVNFLISIREDVLARLDRFERRIPHLFDNYLRLEHLDVAGARQAITKPLEVYNQGLPGDQRVGLEDALIEEVIRQVKIGQDLAQRGPGQTFLRTFTAQPEGEVRVEATFLQLVMKRLWDEELTRNSRTLRLTTLSTLGGKQRIVQTNLDAVLEKLKPDQQQVSAYIFNHLVTPSGLVVALTAEDLATYTQAPLKRIESVVRRLSERDVRVLRPVVVPRVEPAQTRYELFNEMLIPAVVNWRQRYFGRVTIWERLTLPAICLVLVAMVIQPFLNVPPPILALVRGLSLVILNTAALLQVYRWFYRYIGLTVTALPVANFGGPNTGILLGILFTILWYVSTEWPPDVHPANPLGTLSSEKYIFYLFIVMPTLLSGWMTFWVMRSVGKLTYKVCKNFDIGFYGVYFVVCALTGVLVPIMIAHPDWRWIALVR